MVRKKNKSKMILITVHLTEQQIKMLDHLVERKLFPNRSEAIRYAIRRLIEEYTTNERSSAFGGFFNRFLGEGLVLG